MTDCQYKVMDSKSVLTLLSKTIHDAGFKKWLSAAERRMSKALMVNISGPGSGIHQDYVALYLEPKESLLSSLHDLRTGRGLLDKISSLNARDSDSSPNSRLEDVVSELHYDPLPPGFGPSLFALNESGSMILVAYIEGNESGHFAWCEHKSILVAFNLTLHLPKKVVNVAAVHEVAGCVTSLAAHPSRSEIFIIGRVDGCVMTLSFNESSDDSKGSSFTNSNSSTLNLCVPKNNNQTSMSAGSHFEPVTGIICIQGDIFLSIGADGIVHEWLISDRIGEGSRSILISYDQVMTSKSVHAGGGGGVKRNLPVGLLHIAKGGEMNIAVSEVGHVFELNELQFDPYSSKFARIIIYKYTKTILIRQRSTISIRFCVLSSLIPSHPRQPYLYPD